MNTISITHLYELLTSRLGKQAAEDLTTYIEEKVEAQFTNKALILATKFDVADAKEGLVREIADVKTNVIKWMFFFWVGQVAATFGFILLFLKK